MRMTKKVCPKCGGDLWEPSPSGLRKIREAAGLSLAQVAEETGYSKPYLSDIERGNRAPSNQTIIRFYELLERSP